MLIPMRNFPAQYRVLLCFQWEQPKQWAFFTPAYKKMKSYEWVDLDQFRDVLCSAVGSRTTVKDFHHDRINHAGYRSTATWGSVSELEGPKNYLYASPDQFRNWWLTRLEFQQVDKPLQWPRLFAILADGLLCSSVLFSPALYRMLKPYIEKAIKDYDYRFWR